MILSNLLGILLVIGDGHNPIKIGGIYSKIAQQFRSVYYDEVHIPELKPDSPLGIIKCDRYDSYEVHIPLTGAH